MTVGIVSEESGFNFYDGIVIGETPHTITLSEVETGYDLGNGVKEIDSVEYKTAFLKLIPTLNIPI